MTQPQYTSRSSPRTRGDDESSDEALPSDGYPPTNNDVVDTSRVVENLRQWEVAERQRRKAARESAPNSSFPSVMGYITRLLGPGGESSKGFGTHVALQSQENIGSLQVSSRNFDISPSPSPSPSPISNPPHRGSEESQPDNPFADPSLNLPPYFPDSQSQQQPPTRSSTSWPSPLTQTIPSKLTRSATIPHLSQASPTPLVSTAPTYTTNRPPPPTSSPTLISNSAHADEGQREGRWWQDWLCCCRESQVCDSLDDSQAGRTNPFE